MAEASNQSWSTGLVLGAAVAFLLAIVVFVVILPQQRSGTTIDLPDEIEAPQVPEAPELD